MIKRILKAIICCFLIMCLFLSPVCNETVAADDGIYGDMDGNGSITIRDALAVLLYAAKQETLTEGQLQYADVNEDGQVDATDALQIMQYRLCILADFKANEVEPSGTIWIAGDSIAAPGSKDRLVPSCGWGEVIGDYFTEEVTVHNNALGGRSSKSFLEDANYHEIIDNLKAGDYFLISFGHNDMKSDDRYTSLMGDSSTEGCYKYYLKTKYIDPALAKGALPVVLTSVVRASGNFEINDQSHKGWAYAAADLCEEYKAQNIYVPCIDLFNITYDHYKEIGKANALTLYHSVITEGDADSTHYSEAGARWISKIIVNEMKKLDLDITEYVNEDRLAEPDPNIPPTE